MKNEHYKSTPVELIKIDQETHSVTGIVYTPYKLDTYGDFADEDTVKSLCEQFNSVQKFDIMHQRVPISGVRMKKNWISVGEEDIPAGSWVMEVEITDLVLWDRIKSGELNGFSMDILTYLDPVIVQVEFTKIKIAETEPYEEDQHTHLYVIMKNEDGLVDYGRTSTDNGHAHTILRGTATEASLGHKHRIKIYEGSE